MSVRIVTPAGRRTLPWRSGFGRVSEIATSAADTPSGLLWRASVAVVEVDGAFVEFPGCHRVALLIEGRGLDIVIARPGGPSTILRLDTPFDLADFDGEPAPRARLFDGPVTLLNLIVDTSLTVTHRVIGAAAAQSEAGDGRGLVLPAAPLTLLHVLRGDMRLAAGTRHVLSAGDTAVCEGPHPPLTLVPTAADALVFHAMLAPAARFQVGDDPDRQAEAAEFGRHGAADGSAEGGQPRGRG